MQTTGHAKNDWLEKKSEYALPTGDCIINFETPRKFHYANDHFGLFSSRGMLKLAAKELEKLHIHTLEVLHHSSLKGSKWFYHYVWGWQTHISWKDIGKLKFLLISGRFGAMPRTQFAGFVSHLHFVDPSNTSESMKEDKIWKYPSLDRPLSIPGANSTRNKSEVDQILRAF